MIAPTFVKFWASPPFCWPGAWVAVALSQPAGVAPALPLLAHLRPSSGAFSSVLQAGCQSLAIPSFWVIGRVFGRGRFFERYAVRVHRIGVFLLSRRSRPHCAAFAAYSSTLNLAFMEATMVPDFRVGLFNWIEQRHGSTPKTYL